VKTRFFFAVACLCAVQGGGGCAIEDVPLDRPAAAPLGTVLPASSCGEVPTASPVCASGAVGAGWGCIARTDGGHWEATGCPAVAGDSCSVERCGPLPATDGCGNPADLAASSCVSDENGCVWTFVACPPSVVDAPCDPRACGPVTPATCPNGATTKDVVCRRGNVRCEWRGRTCTAATCSDGVKNATETDVDCGGACGACPVGAKCSISEDCAVGTCRGNRCR
jgi:hypothetical protein